MFEQLGEHVPLIVLKTFELGQLQVRLVWFQTKLGLQTQEPGRELTFKVKLMLEQFNTQIGEFGS
jgi:hypothetical protein